jgi:hypothetical protein
MIRKAGHDDDTIYEPFSHDTRDDLDVELLGELGRREIMFMRPLRNFAYTLL